MTAKKGQHPAAARKLRASKSQDLIGQLRTQTGPRTTAPMWVRPLLTVGEWAVFTALWSYPETKFPTHQELADRAWCQRGTAADAIARFDELGLLVREPNQREDGSDTSNTYYLVEVPSRAQQKLLDEKWAAREVEQQGKRKERKARNRAYEAKAPASAEPIAVEADPIDDDDAIEGGYGRHRTRGTASTVPKNLLVLR